MTNPWFKVYGGEYLSDPKIAALNGEERSCWLTLLCLASTSSIPGTVEYLTREVLLEKSGVRRNEDVTFQPLQSFEKMKMISIKSDTLIEILNWHKRQQSAMSVTERVQKYRAKQKHSNEDVTVVTNGNESANDRREKNRIEKKKEDIKKDVFGQFENVLLLPEEYHKLVEQIGSNGVDSLIEDLSGYIESTGKKYKSHYATIQNWARRRINDHVKEIKNKPNVVAF